MRRERAVRRTGLAFVAGVVVVLTALIPGAAPTAADGDEAPGRPAPFRSLTAGGHHTCAIVDTGDVKCWGENGRGQLGIGSTTDKGLATESMTSLPPVELGAGRTATALSAGAEHTCALLDDGSVKCWGWAYYGQLGQGEGLDQLTAHNRGDQPGEMGDDLPTVDLGTGRTATAIASGGNGTCALLDDGNVRCWGSNGYGESGFGGGQGIGDEPGEMGDALPVVALGTGRTATSVTAGTEHRCALLDDGALKCWGRNNYGQLGIGDTVDRGPNPSLMGDLLPSVALGTGRQAVAVTAGLSRTCALLDDARVKCWGRNGQGALGIGDVAARGVGPDEMGDQLPAVALGTGRTAVALAAGASHTCALLDTGAVKCWGANGGAQLGVEDKVHRGDQPSEMGDALPRTRLGTGLRASALVAGDDHSCARLEDGTYRCWGTGSSGELGIGHSNTHGSVQGGVPGSMGPNLLPVLISPVAPALTTGVTGHVTEVGTGEDLGGTWVALLRSSDFGIAAHTVVANDGSYLAPAPPGSYLVYLIDPTGRHRAGFFGPPTTVDVTTGPLAEADPTMAPTRGFLAGTVTDQGNGSPVPGAWVITMDAATGVPQRGAVADGAGNYVVEDLVPGGRFVAAADPTGTHHPRYFPDMPSFVGALPLDVAAGATTVADLALPAKPAPPGAAALTGTVTETGTGLPLAGVYVLALRASDFSVAAGAITSGAGTYNLAVDQLGHHLMFFDPSGRHAMEWHDDQPPDGLAASATITAPANTNVALAPTTGSLSGTLTEDVLGDPVPGGWVVAIGPTGIAGGAITTESGVYTIDHLPPGSYRATFVDPGGAWAQEYWPDRLDYDTAAVIAVTAGDDTPLIASLART